MNHFRLLATATILIFAFAAAAQQSDTSGTSPAKSASGSEHSGVPTVETQLKFLSGKLDLTSGQQEKIKPILQGLHDASMKLVRDESLPRNERLDKIRDSRYAADRKIRAILTDDQRTKLDQIEQEPHPELHGGVNATQN